jgi:hypothetical protein
MFNVEPAPGPKIEGGENIFKGPTPLPPPPPRVSASRAGSPLLSEERLVTTTNPHPRIRHRTQTPHVRLLWHRDMYLVPSKNGRRLSSSRTQLKELDDELKETCAEVHNSDTKAPPSALSLGREYSREWDKVSNARNSGRHPIGARARERSSQCSRLNLTSAYMTELVDESLASLYQATATLLDEQRLVLEDVRGSVDRMVALCQQLVDSQLQKRSSLARGRAVEATNIPMAQLDAFDSPLAPMRVSSIQHKRYWSERLLPCPRPSSVPTVSIPERLPVTLVAKEMEDTSKGRTTLGSLSISTIPSPVRLSATSVIRKGEEVAVVPLPVPSTRELSISSPQHVLGRDSPAPAHPLVVYCSEQPMTVSPCIPSDRELPSSSQGRNAVQGISTPLSPAKACPPQSLPHATGLIVAQEARTEASARIEPGRLSVTRSRALAPLILSPLAQESLLNKYERTSHSRAKPKEPNKAQSI